MKWYEDKDKVIELAEFMVYMEEIDTIEELLDYFKHPDIWTEVWELYDKEIKGWIKEYEKLDKLVIISPIPIFY